MLYVKSAGQNSDGGTLHQVGGWNFASFPRARHQPYDMVFLWGKVLIIMLKPLKTDVFVWSRILVYRHMPLCWQLHCIHLCTCTSWYILYINDTKDLQWVTFCGTRKKPDIKSRLANAGHAPRDVGKDLGENLKLALGSKKCGLRARSCILV